VGIGEQQGHQLLTLILKPNVKLRCHHRLNELGFSVPLETKQVILEMFIPAKHLTMIGHTKRRRDNRTTDQTMGQLKC